MADDTTRSEEVELERVAGSRRVVDLARGIVESLRSESAPTCVSVLSVASCLAAARYAVDRDLPEAFLLEKIVEETNLRVRLVRAEYQLQQLKRARRTSVVDDGPEIDGN